MIDMGSDYLPSCLLCPTGFHRSVRRLTSGCLLCSTGLLSSLNRLTSGCLVGPGFHWPAATGGKAILLVGALDAPGLLDAAGLILARLRAANLPGSSRLTLVIAISRYVWCRYAGDRLYAYSVVFTLSLRCFVSSSIFLCCALLCRLLCGACSRLRSSASRVFLLHFSERVCSALGISRHPLGFLHETIRYHLVTCSLGNKLRIANGRCSTLYSFHGRSHPRSGVQVNGCVVNSPSDFHVALRQTFPCLFINCLMEQCRPEFTRVRIPLCPRGL
jgi:hypothetical protein